MPSLKRSPFCLLPTFLLLVLLVRVQATFESANINTTAHYGNGGERCQSSEECAEDRACLQNLCQDPCLNFCKGDIICQVLRHNASCHTNNSTMVGVESKTPSSERSKAIKLDNGPWIPHSYSVMFPFTIEGEQFFYGQCENWGNWFIQKLLPNGTMGPETDHGEWRYFYKTQFPFSVGGKTYFYGQLRYLFGNNWFIQELLPGGKMGEETDHGTWTNFYIQCFPYYAELRVFVYCYTNYTNYWFIQELLPGGKMGEETANGQWGGFHNEQNPISVSIV